MFFGGTVPDLSNIPNLPNVPNLTQTGATPQVQQPAPPPAPVTMNQQKLDLLVGCRLEQVYQHHQILI